VCSLLHTRFLYRPHISFPPPLAHPVGWGLPHHFPSALIPRPHKRETVRYLVLDLLWKSIWGMLRFILVETARGRIIIMTYELTLDPATAIQLYCPRVTIKTMFDTLKNTLGAMAYHFWSHYLCPASRRPKKNQEQEQNSFHPTQTRNTLAAIEKSVNVQLLVLGMLQLIAKKFPAQVKAKANCWLRTFSANTPSEFVTRTALVNVIKKIYTASLKT